MYHSSYLVYPRVPPPHQLLLHPQETVTDTEIPATRRSERRARTHQHEETRGMNQQKSKTPNKNDDEELQDDELQGVRDSLHEFKHGLLMNVSQNIEMLPVLLMNYFWRAKVVPRQQNIFTLFPEDPNCDICLRTKITRASCRRGTCTVVPRAENFWWFNNCGSQSPEWRMWVSTWTSIRCGGTRLGYSVAHWRPLASQMLACSQLKSFRRPYAVLMLIAIYLCQRGLILASAARHSTCALTTRSGISVSPLLLPWNGASRVQFKSELWVIGHESDWTSNQIMSKLRVQSADWARKRVWAVWYEGCHCVSWGFWACKAFQGLKKARCVSRDTPVCVGQDIVHCRLFGVEHDDHHESGSTLRYCVGLLFPILQGSRRLILTTDVQNFSHRLKVIELVCLATCVCCLLVHWVSAQRCVSTG